jgi:hypothetical protein
MTGLFSRCLAAGMLGTCLTIRTPHRPPRGPRWMVPILGASRLRTNLTNQTARWR